MPSRAYRGRIAPTPTGYLHLGHAHTFAMAAQRCRAAEGTLILRIEDLDQQRCRPAYTAAALEDLRWLGLDWDEGPDCGGAYGPYVQSERRDYFQHIGERLRQTGHIYASPHSRSDIEHALNAPHTSDGEVLFPTALRPEPGAPPPPGDPASYNWRFRVPDGVSITFQDARCGACSYTAGRDFGDFLVWRRDGFPSYELAVVADDHAMGITEVVRGEDLLLSTARQLLLYAALGWEAPTWCHAPLICDEQGRRLAKRDDARSIRSWREQGKSPAELLVAPNFP